MRRAMTMLATAGAMLAIAGCGEKNDRLSVPAGDSQSFSLMLDYLPNADHVGIYEALANHTFAHAGLNVKVRTPSDPTEPLKLLAAGKIDAAISYEPEVLLARNQGEPLVSIAALVQTPLTSIISVGGKGITKPSQLAGKTIGTAGIPYQTQYLDTILAHAGVAQKSVKTVNVGFNLVPSMISGKVDATLGGYWNYEALQLQEEGKSPNVIKVNNAGVPTYDELVLVVRKGEIIDKANLLRRFVQALGRGYEAVKADPTGAVQNLVKANPSLNEKLQMASVKATLPYYFSPQASKPWGYQNIKQWNAFGSWMLSHHLITDPNNDVIPQSADNELLAGQGLA